MGKILNSGKENKQKYRQQKKEYIKLLKDFEESRKNKKDCI